MWVDGLACFLRALCAGYFSTDSAPQLLIAPGAGPLQGSLWVLDGSTCRQWGKVSDHARMHGHTHTRTHVYAWAAGWSTDGLSCQRAVGLAGGQNAPMQASRAIGMQDRYTAYRGD